LYDERFSSVTVDRMLVEAGVRRERRRQVRDKLAAAVMLQAYLDSR
jgi:putative Holliday junction resolvase